jgi:hypothetical protein
MTTKKFEIAGRTAGHGGTATPTRDDAMDRFIEGKEPMTTMTFQLPIRLQRVLKQAALDRQLTVKALLIELIEGQLITTKK